MKSIRQLAMLVAMICAGAAHADINVGVTLSTTGLSAAALLNSVNQPSP